MAAENLEEESLTGAGSLYRALVALWSHHERMLWSRVQTLIAVQAAVIGGSYAIGNHQLAGLFMVAGAVLSLVVYELVSKDLLDRDANLAVINELGIALLPRAIEETSSTDPECGPQIQMQAEPPAWRPFMRSRYLIRIVVWSFITFDITLAVLHFAERVPVVSSGN